MEDFNGNEHGVEDYKADDNGEAVIEQVDEEDDESCQILIIDDNHLNTEAVLGLLQQFSLPASSATSGAQAIRMVKNRLNRADLKIYKLIMVDYSMPQMDGFECIR